MTDDIQVICEVIKDDSISIAEDQLFAVPKALIVRHHNIIR